MADWVEVRFLPADRRVWVRPGATLVETAEAAGLEIVTGCTKGMCGTDPARITAGGDNLSAPAEHERGTLERMGLEVGVYRLACSARVERDRVEIELDTF